MWAEWRAMRRVEYRKRRSIAVAYTPRLCLDALISLDLFPFSRNCSVSRQHEPISCCWPTLPDGRVAVRFSSVEYWSRHFFLFRKSERWMWHEARLGFIDRRRRLVNPPCIHHSFSLLQSFPFLLLFPFFFSLLPVFTLLSSSPSCWNLFRPTLLSGSLLFLLPLFLLCFPFSLSFSFYPSICLVVLSLSLFLFVYLSIYVCICI